MSSSAVVMHCDFQDWGVCYGGCCSCDACLWLCQSLCCWWCCLCCLSCTLRCYCHQAWHCASLGWCDAHLMDVLWHGTCACQSLYVPHSYLVQLGQLRARQSNVNSVTAQQGARAHLLFFNQSVDAVLCICRPACWCCTLLLQASPLMLHSSSPGLCADLCSFFLDQSAHLVLFFFRPLLLMLHSSSSGRRAGVAPLLLQANPLMLHPLHLQANVLMFYSSSSG